MRHGISEFLAICTIALVSLLSVNAAAVPALHEESFEGCTGSGYSLLSGYFGGDAIDGIECGPTFTFTSQSGAVTGFQGSNYIALEDIDDVGYTNPNAVVLSSVNIANATDLEISFLFAAPNATSTRYETNDILQVQYSVDSGPFVTVGSFRGTGAIGMAEDTNLDGSFPTAVNGLAMQRFSYTLNNRAGAGTVSGSTLVVRILFSSEGSHEEMMFDDIIITGTVAPAVPIVDFATSSYAYNEDGTPVSSTVTLTRTGATAGAATIDMTFSAGSATAGTDFTATTTSVSFLAGQTSKTVTLPIIDDDIDENNETFTLGLAADGSGAVVGTTITSSTITIVDNDTADITVSESALTIAESGTTDTFTVVLETQPTSNVGVDLSVASGQALLASGGSPASSLTLTFTSGNWNTPQTVTVSAVNDQVVEANPHSDTITLTVDSTDLKYDGFALTDVSVSVGDNDNCGDAFCNPSESTATCPADCGSSCGDTVCNGSEATTNCATDCGTNCGDTVCNGSESTANCVADCGTSCGDTVCNGSESTANCVTDCGSNCGDTVCNGSESTATCVTDCGTNCGDTVCNGSESTATCVADCGTSCGDTVCNGSESTANCVADCGSNCGDTVCNGSETTANCVTDCGSNCGDTACNGSETTANCVTDCGSSCGDTVCNGSETTANCFVDCGSSCGDSAVNGSEVCDGLVLSGETCVSQGFDYGILLCSNDCTTFDTSGCDYNVADAGADGGVGADAGVSTSGTAVSDTAGSDTTVDLSSSGATSEPVSEDTSAATSEATSGSGVGTTFDISSSGLTTGPETSAVVTSEDGDTSTPDNGSTGVVPTSGVATSEMPVSTGTGPVATSETPVGTDTEPVATSETSVVDTTSEPAGTDPVDSTVPATTGGNTATGEVVTTEPGTSAVYTGSGDTSVGDTGPVTTSGEVTEDDTNDGNPGPDTTEPNDTSGPGPVGPGPVVDAGVDAGADAGFIDDTTQEDGCDCRIGARSHSNKAGLLALGLVGLALVRIRQRRKS